MKERWTPVFLVILALVASTLACNLPGDVDADATLLARSVQETVAAEVSQDGLQPQDQAQAPEGGEEDEPAMPTDAAEPTSTPTITPTPTPSVPMVSVSVNTNCRTGPGTAYDLVGGLLVGETAEIVALSSVSNYVIIELPDGSGRDCWLWMQYGTQTGDTTGLPVLTPPPTPTPPPPPVAFSMALEDVQTCATSEVVFYRVVNTGGVPLESYRVTAENLDTAETVSVQYDYIPGFAACIVQVLNEPFEVGDTGYIRAAFTPPIAGDTISATITMCTEDGLGGECTSQSLTVTLASLSDVNAKENFAAVDNQQILDDLMTIPITTWTYIDQEREGRHIGPMAQDFNQTFGVGEYDNMLQAVDIYGVAFASIQALAERNAAQAEDLAALQAQNEALLARIEALETNDSPGGQQLQRFLWLAGIPVFVTASLLAGFLLGQRRRKANHFVE